jgi:hypothetical protein
MGPPGPPEQGPAPMPAKTVRVESVRAGTTPCRQALRQLEL